MMRKVLLVLIGIFLISSFSESYAGSVRGYYRKDGTYVRPHQRSNPDGHKWNNFGPSQSESDRYNPYGRDYDRDGTSNYLDWDDDNDGIGDDYE